MTELERLEDEARQAGYRVVGQRGDPGRPPRWAFTATAGPSRLDIDDDIGGLFGIPARAVVEAIRAAGARPLEVHLNSAGGDVFEGFRIYNALKAHGAPVDIIVEALAGSIASIIALAGSTVRMKSASMLMVHEPHGMTAGTAHDHRHMATVLDRVGGLMADIYDLRARNRDLVRKWMHDETWMTAPQALDAGLIDAIDDVPLAAAALASAQAFDYSAVRHRPPAESPPPPRPAVPRARDHAHLLATGFDLLLGAGAPARKE